VITITSETRIKEITGNLKRDMKDLPESEAELSSVISMEHRLQKGRSQPEQVR